MNCKKYKNPSADFSAEGFVLLHKPNYLDSLIAAWAAARRAMGTRKGEQDT